MGVVKIRTVCSVRRTRSANCWRVPARMISYLSELWKVRRSGTISKSRPFLSLQIILEPFIFFAHTMCLWLAIRATQEEAGEHVYSHVKELVAALTRARCDSTYLPTNDHMLVYWLEKDCICQKQSFRNSNNLINRAVNVLVIDT